MKLSELLRKACKDMHITMTELARRTDQTPQNLSIRLKKDTISFKEFQRYMELIGIRAELNLIYPEGNNPEMPIQDLRAQEKISILEEEIANNQRKLDYQKKLSADIRTAMYNVIGYADLALQGGDDKHVKEYLEKIRDSKAKLQSLFDSSIFLGDAKEEEPAEEKADPSTVVGKRVLLVEDNEMNREITKDILAENGMKIEEAENGKEAVEKVEKAAPGYYDCILMDIEMPVMNGLEATAAIRSLPNRIRAGVPVIAMTASAFAEDKKKCMDAGMDSYLTKPADAEKMIKIIAEYV